MSHPLKLSAIWIALRNDDKDWMIGNGTRKEAVDNAKRLRSGSVVGWRAVRFIPAAERQGAAK